MTNNDTYTLLHKAIKIAPEYGIFPLLGCLEEAMDNEKDPDKISQAYGPVRKLFMESYGNPDPSGHSNFFSLNDAGRKLRAEPLSN
ncbi:MAG: hypothetical protein V4635_09435 [Bacteroidota bacterium]